MKIGIYSFEYPSHIYIGGAGDYVKQLAENLARLGHKVDVFVASFEAGPPAIADGVTVRTIPIPGMKRSTVRAPSPKRREPVRPFRTIPVALRRAQPEVIDFRWWKRMATGRTRRITARRRFRSWAAVTR